MNWKTLRTLEFLLAVLTNVAAWVAAAADAIDPRFAVYATAASGALYALARGLAKLNADSRDYWRTTEFWFGVATSLGAVVATFADVLPSDVYALVQAAILSGLGIGNALRKVPETQAGG